MKIHIVNYELGRYNGILSKFANKMVEELKRVEGIEVTMSERPSKNADVNHHINYQSFHFDAPGTINTLMVTHITTPSKLENLKRGMEKADWGVCMSKETEKMLIDKGLDKKKLSTVLPAHDGKPRRMQVVAILTNVYPDGCKRQEMFTELVKNLDVKKWAFRIMGKDWHDILVPLVAEGLQVDYFAEFDEENHQRILDTSDYNLYFGEDEGSMAVLDAKNAGLKIIAPPVGFHIEIGVDYPFHTQKELNSIFKKLSINPVEDWNWKRYVDQHLILWNKLKNN